MFTGLVEHAGRVVALEAIEGGYRLSIETPLASELRDGDSIAVNGVCLTVVGRDADRFATEIGPETARVTTLGACRPGTRVNLERPMRPDGRMGGHFVLGHVDGTGTLTAIRPDGDFYWLTVSFDPALAAYFIPKGSVAVDGISLTVAALREREFDVQIIPFTWDHTNLAASRVGDGVNLEVDVIGKYVLRVAQLAGMWPAGGPAPLDTP
ncbi:MAG: riboflavin synthase [Acidobacteria bacterium]|nr:riboflavin synthase [Acidobacteriota bacterium]